MRDLLEEQDAYDVYCKAMYKDGIPYRLISKAVPYIQHQANLILNQIADFQVELDTDGKNINAFIQYEDEKWALELSSGMERFMSSIAIRIALIKITNLLNLFLIQTKLNLKFKKSIKILVSAKMLK